MKYSILIPCWKQEELVGPCLDSVVAQSVHDWEAICTDDGGPDRTGDVLDQYVKENCPDVRTWYVDQDGERKRVLEGRHPCGGIIKVVHQKNGGLSAARNAAKRISDGEWYVNLDGDDLLSPAAFEICERAQKICPEVDIIIGGFRRFLHGTTPAWNEQTQDVVVHHMPDCVMQGLEPGAFQQMIVHKRICGDMVLEGPNWSEERLYTARCLVRAHHFAVTESDVYGYRNHPGQFTRHGMKLDELKGYLEASQLIISLYDTCGRPVESGLRRMQVMHWLEWVPRDILIQVSKQDRAEAWRYWFSMLGAFKAVPRLSLWTRFVVITCSFFPFWPIAWILCCCPDWLKRHGVHRCS